MEITWEDVKNTAIDIREELGSFTAPQEQFVLDLANDDVPLSKFGKKTFAARCYYAAHHATIRYGPPAGEGTQSSVGVDSFSSGVTLAVNNPTPDKNILSTAYGREYHAIMWKNAQHNFAG